MEHVVGKLRSDLGNKIGLDGVGDLAIPGPHMGHAGSAHVVPQRQHHSIEDGRLVDAAHHHTLVH